MFKALDKNNNPVFIDEADREETYYCQLCHQELTQKRGDIKAHHFAHLSPKGTSGEYTICKDEWEYEHSDWYKCWIRRFSNRELETVLEHNGIRHIADVFVNNTVIQFQQGQISLSMFEAKNRFFKDCGYKVIWVFDETFEKENKYICLEPESKLRYSWTNPRRALADLTLPREDVSVYFEFEEKGSTVLHRILSSKGEFKNFLIEPRCSLTIDEFVTLAKTNIKPLTKGSGEKIASIVGLWKPEYLWMTIQNVDNGKVVRINGKDGSIMKNDYYRVVGRYCRYDKNKNRYELFENAKFLPIKDEGERLWKLLFAYVDKECEVKLAKKRKEEEELLKQKREEKERLNEIERAIEEERRKEEEVKEDLLKRAQPMIDSCPKRIEKAYELEFLISIKRENTIYVRNEYTKAVYKIEKRIDQSGRMTGFSAYKINSKTGKENSIDVAFILEKIKANCIWRYFEK